MKIQIQIQAKGPGQKHSHVCNVDLPCTVEVEIGKRFMKFEVDKDGGVRLDKDSGSPEHNAV